jgi:hypothetical protein|tara:strand:+ start:157 stop:528 length:372 start_codon:yes stop_codon:yes gene_type:complete
MVLNPPTYNRLTPIVEELNGMEDPDDMMLSIISVLDESGTVPQVGNYYTFIYKPKTPNITYDEHPLIACTEITEWGFKGINFHHGGELRFYTFPEIVGQVHLVRGSEFEDIKHIPYARIKTSR